MNTHIEAYCNLSSNSPAICNSEREGLCTREGESICPYRGDVLTTYTFEVTIQMQANSQESRADLLNRLYDSIHGIAGIEDHSIS